jgi:hypothetical protein
MLALCLGRGGPSVGWAQGTSCSHQVLERRIAEILGRRVDLLPQPVEKPRLRTSIRIAVLPSRHGPDATVADISENAAQVEGCMAGMDQPT